MKSGDLKERTARERTAYNSGDVYKNNDKLHRKYMNVFECPNTIRSEKYFHTSVKEKSKNAAVLDCGCHNGELTAKIIGYGAKTPVGIDISEKSVAFAKSNMRQPVDGNTLTEPLFCAGDMHQTCFKNSTFDLVVGRAILHHLNFENAMTEIHRILKPGGYAIFIEAMGDNPMAKLFRLLTPNARTADEKPLSRKEIINIDKMFTQSSHLFFNLFSVPAGMATSLVNLPPKNILTVISDKIDMLFAKTYFKYWMRAGIFIWKK